ncbi:hypothetical protein V8G54_002997 [Vigna mungo]|uniref:Uncharacterized protein n=1 Tax=Vigna mungo TaxID=3915 RepID=A0AAQ3SCH8_VIGMU
MHNRHTYPNTNHHNSQRQRHLQSNPHPPFLHINYIRLSILLTPPSLHCRQHMILLQIKHIANHPTQQYVYKSKPHQHKQYREKFSGCAIRCDVTISYCAHCDYTKIQRINYRMSLGSRKIMTIEPINDNP